MDQYTAASYKASQLVTTTYSTSFGLSIRLFEASLRRHIYAIYALVRIADEIVDTYTGPDKSQLLDDLEAQVGSTLQTGYSTNPIVHAFATTARQYGIGTGLLTPFFNSMRMDITPKQFDQTLYEAYIYGSAEVVGLMCLKVFTNDAALYKKLEAGASSLGAAYQKINFLRDIAADAEGLGRWYFPIASFETFDETIKLSITKDIEKDFAAAKKAIVGLPASSRKAVTLSYQYYTKLLKQIEKTSVTELKKRRIRVNDIQKLALFLQTSMGNNRA